MADTRTNRVDTWRWAPGLIGVVATAFALRWIDSSAAAEQLQLVSTEEAVRDKFWIFTCVAGADNEGWNLPRPSRMTPAEGAYYLGVPNLMMIRWKDKPPTPFDQYALALRPLKRVVWSLVGSGGKTKEEGREHALGLAARSPNLVGFIMDDFFHRDGSGTLSPEELDLEV